jgi:hypothetical protein
MKRIALSLLLVAVTAGAAVASSKVLILKADGRADAKTRAKVDAAIVKLAKTGPDTVTPGEITFADAAAMVGCRAEDAACAHEVASTLGVDEVAIVTVTPKPPDGYEVKIRRAGKGAPKDATATVAVDKLDKLDALAPMFGGKAPAPTFEPPGGTPNKPIGPEPAPSITTKPPVVVEPVKPETKVEPPKTEPTPDLSPMSSNSDPTKPTVTAQPSDKQPKDRRRLYIAGMATGGAMAFLGIILWTTASGVQGQIDESPTRTRADLIRLQDLENKADGLAGAGNFFFVTGLIVAGASTYFYIKNERSKKQRSKTALLPTVFPGGAGVTLSFGGTP